MIRFVFSGLAPGTYAIEASHNGFVYRNKAGNSPFSLNPGETRSNLELTMVPAGVISGVITDCDGEPVEGLSVLALRVQYEPGGKRELYGAGDALTDDLGRFRLHGLVPGLYYLRTGGTLQRPMQTVPLKESPESALQYAETWYPQDALAEDGGPLRVGAGEILKT